MATHRLVVLLVAASFVGAAIASPQATSGKKDETSNIIPVDGEANSSSPAPAGDSSSSSTSPSAATTATTTTSTSKPEEKVTGRPATALGSGFSRFINDIFQIPISVLRAVNNLLSNPFNRERDASAAAPKKASK